MLDLDCPSCDGRLVVDEAMTQVTCDTCRVTAEIAPDPVREPAALAA